MLRPQSSTDENEKHRFAFVKWWKRGRGENYRDCDISAKTEFHQKWPVGARKIERLNLYIVSNPTKWKERAVCNESHGLASPFRAEPYQQRFKQSGVPKPVSQFPLFFPKHIQVDCRRIEPGMTEPFSDRRQRDVR